MSLKDYLTEKLDAFIFGLLESSEELHEGDGGVYISENPGEFEAGYGDGQRRRISVE